MSLATNVRAKRGIYHFRRKVPHSLRGRFGCREIVRSLGTTNLLQAAHRARVLWLRCAVLFDAVKTAPTLSRDQIETIVRRWLDHRLWRDEVRLSVGAPLLDSLGGAAPDEADALEGLAESYRRALAGNDLSEIETLLREVAGENGIDAGSADGRVLGRTLLRGIVDYIEEVRRRRDGIYREPLVGSAAPAAPTPVAEAAARPEPVGFAVHWEAYKAAMLRAGQWTNHTAGQNDLTLRLWRSVSGDPTLDACVRRHVAAFRSVLARLPADYGKAARWRGQQPAAVADAADAEAIATRLSEKTVIRHLAALSGYWKWLEDEGHVPAGWVNPFAGMTKRRRKTRAEVKEERPMWSRDDLRRLFASPLWTGCLSEARRWQPGPHVIRDDRFWVPLIAVHSGMRLEEIAQLYVGDVRYAGGVWFFDLKADEGQSLKRDSSVRRVPLHDTLLHLGLIDQRVAGKPLRHRLFPELQPRGRDRRLGVDLTKWFTAYRRRIGLYEPGKDFHAFRHTVTTLLANAGANLAWIDELTGHASPGKGSETDRYIKAIDLSNLKATIDRLDLGIDFSGLFVAGAGEGRAP